MRVLHFIPERTENKDVRKEYFRHLMKMSGGVEMRILTTDGDSGLDKAEKLPHLLPVINNKVSKVIEEFHPDIIHIHGCTGMYEAKVFGTAEKYRIPVIISPLGDLAAMTLTERSLTKKLSSEASRARKLLTGADAIHVTGELEMETVRKTQLIPGKSIRKDISRKTFMIKNSVLTNSITPEMMCLQLIRLYKKVIGWRPYDVMLDETKECEKLLLRTGVCRQFSKFGENEHALARDISEEELEKIFVHAEIQNVRDYIDAGCREFGIPFAPERETCRLKAGITESIDDDTSPVFKETEKIKSKNNSILRDFENYGEETTLYCLIAEIQNLMHRGTLTYRHLAELCRIIIKTDYREDVVSKMLKDCKIYDFSSRLMYITGEYAGLPEGFMPIEPRNDKKSKDIITFITLKSR